MPQRHPGVLLCDYSMEIPKDQRRERIWEILSTVKYFTNAVYLSCIGHLLSATHVIWAIAVCRVLSLSLLPSWPTLGGLTVPPLETMASGSSHCILPQTEHVLGQGRESGIPEAAQRCQKMQHISTNGSQGWILWEAEFTSGHQETEASWQINSCLITGSHACERHRTPACLSGSVPRAEHWLCFSWSGASWYLFPASLSFPYTLDISLACACHVYIHEMHVLCVCITITKWINIYWEMCLRKLTKANRKLG